MRQSNLPAKITLPILLIVLGILGINLAPYHILESKAPSTLSSFLQTFGFSDDESFGRSDLTREKAEGLDSHQIPSAQRHILLVANNVSIATPCSLEKSTAPTPLAPTVRTNFCPQELHLISCLHKDIASLNIAAADPLWLRLQVILI